MVSARGQSCATELLTCGTRCSAGKLLYVEYTCAQSTGTHIWPRKYSEEGYCFCPYAYLCTHGAQTLSHHPTLRSVPLQGPSAVMGLALLFFQEAARPPFPLNCAAATHGSRPERAIVVVFWLQRENSLQPQKTQASL